MKKVVFIMVALLLVLTGCGQKELTNKDIETSVKNLGYKTGYFEQENSDGETVGVMLLEKGTTQLFYNSLGSWGISKNKYTVHIPMDTGNSPTCFYDFEKNKSGEDATCSKEDIEVLKNYKNDYHRILKNEIGITEKQYVSFMKYEMKIEKKDYVPEKKVESKEPTGNTKDELKLKEMGYSLIDGVYKITNNTADFYGLGVPNIISIDVIDKDVSLVFSDGSVVMLGMYGGTRASEIKADNAICSLDINTRSWITDNCGPNEATRLMEFHKAYLKFIEDNQLFY